MTRVYYKYAHGALIVFDLSRPETFENALSWLSDVTEKLFDERQRAINDQDQVRNLERGHFPGLPGEKILQYKRDLSSISFPRFFSVCDRGGE